MRRDDAAAAAGGPADSQYRSFVCLSSPSHAASPPLCQKGGFEGGCLGERRTVPVRCGAPIPSSLPLHTPRGCRARGIGVMTGGVARLIPCPMMDGVGGWGIDVLSVRDRIDTSLLARAPGLEGCRARGNEVMTGCLKRIRSGGSGCSGLQVGRRCVVATYLSKRWAQLVPFPATDGLALLLVLLRTCSLIPTR